MGNAKLLTRDTGQKDANGQPILEYSVAFPITTPEALISYGLNVGINIPHSDPHTVLWEQVKPDGQIILNQ